MDIKAQPLVKSHKPKDYFSKEKFALKVLGLSLTGNESFAYKVYSFFFLSLVNYLYPFLDVGDLFKHDFSIVADILIYQFAVFVGMAKTTTVLLNRKKFIRMLNKLEEEPFAANFKRGGKEEQKLINEGVAVTNMQTRAYWACTAFCVFGTILLTFYIRLINDDYHSWRFPYGVFTIINVTYSPNYELAWFYQSFSVATIGCHFTTIDLITAGFLCHISVQFKVLQNNLKRLVRNAYNEMLRDMNNYKSLKGDVTVPDTEINAASIPWKYLKISLKEAVEYHLAIFEMINEVESIFSTVLLFVFLGTLGMMCFIVYKTTAMQQHDFRLAITLAEAGSCCMQVLTVCYWGEQVLHESQQVGKAAVQDNFVGADQRFQKGLVLIIRRSQYPIRLSAGKFADISLATFTWIIRTSYSAFMVVRKNEALN